MNCKPVIDAWVLGLTWRLNWQACVRGLVRQ